MYAVVSCLAPLLPVLAGVLLAVEFRGRGLSGWLWGDELED